MVKNKIVAAPQIDETELSLWNRLPNLFARIEPYQLKSVWKESIRNCQDYWKIYLEELEEGVEEDGDEGGVEEDDNVHESSYESDKKIKQDIL